MEDCKIIHLRLDEYCISDARANSIRYCHDDVELLVPLQRDTLQKSELYKNMIDKSTATEKWVY